MNNVIIDGEDNPITFIFAHGAGAGMDHEFMQSVAKGLAFKGIRVVRFNFPYMIKRAEDGKRRPPDRAPKLLEAYQEVIEQVDTDKLVIGGKSMGGRMASHLSEVDKVAAMACLGFPFHPPGKPEKYKGEHLAELAKPCLILQGERDTFGKREEFADFDLSDSIRVEFIPDGDHSFKPRKSSGYTEQQNIALTVEKLSAFIKEVLNEK
ncbi:alpha/beta fold hydrolase [Vibrio gigantis]|uniref:Alpha/beta fold hydrolase n=1 Tax=Vibrio gigantis TaxID=296199 RepID=A0A5M9NYB7_9VIBR|nr:alpha/beta fold hydrolase [Vibrio gigantis]KAA8676728.1 alpha/beta fold hydrolase [Vibrio gigantis]ULN63650.1 alpha/beta fold hydrolase [Vibrio gigantis]